MCAHTSRESIARTHPAHLGGTWIDCRRSPFNVPIGTSAACRPLPKQQYMCMGAVAATEGGGGRITFIQPQSFKIQTALIPSILAHKQPDSCKYTLHMPGSLTPYIYALYLHIRAYGSPVRRHCAFAAPISSMSTTPGLSSQQRLHCKSGDIVCNQSARSFSLSNRPT